MTSVATRPPRAMPIDDVLPRLTRVRQSSKSTWSACCPAHEDREPSLSVSVNAIGAVLLNCHRGCPPEDIVTAIGLTLADLFPASTRAAPNTLHVVRAGPNPAARPARTGSWNYVDEARATLFTTERLEYPLEPGEAKPRKKFRQSRPNPADPAHPLWDLVGVRLVLYRLPDVLAAVDDGKRVYVVEGERHADALWALGLPATTNPMGAGKWREPYSAILAHADVVILPDNDDVGRAHAEQVAASLTAAQCTVRVVTLPNLPEKGDVLDWLASPDGRGDPGALGLIQLAEDAPIWTRDALDARVAASAAVRQTRYTLRELLANDEVMRPPMAVVPRIAWGGRLTMLAGLWKIGKSTLTGYLAACVTNGTPFLDVEPCQQGDVLLIGLEEWIGDPARRLRAFGADLDRMHIVDKLIAPLPERMDELRGHIDAVRPAFVIIDSLIKFGGALIENENDAAQMQRVVDPLADLAHEYGETGLLAIAHARKSDGRARGSGATMGAVDIVCEFMQPEATMLARPTLRRMFTVGRVPVPSVYDFVYDGRHYATANEEQVLGEPPVQSLASRVLEYIRDHPACSAREVREVVPGGNDSINAMIVKLLTEQALVDAGSKEIGRKLYVPGAALAPRSAPDAGVRVDSPRTHASTGLRPTDIHEDAGDVGMVIDPMATPDHRRTTSRTTPDHPGTASGPGSGPPPTRAAR